ncbi:type II toxin-antitoxin system MqsA family antitoxin [Ectopseudomonas khazarica]|uniref:Type II toxin-antitoxin system MqsA family antitoxin n=1 Tax=Ectopseudomonas khazarica TaxID=2502979 RepID=A0ABW7M7B5_9GAMM
MKCPVCGSADLAREKRDMPFTYREQTTVVIEVDADWCNACGEALIGPEQSDRVTTAMKRFRQQVDGG